MNCKKLPDEKRVHYGIYSDDVYEELIFFGTAEEVAKFMGWSNAGSTYSAASRKKHKNCLWGKEKVIIRKFEVEKNGS